MAIEAVLVELTRIVIGIRRPIEICLMALYAVRVLQLIIPIQVAVTASDGEVSTGQGKRRRCMVEGCRFPACGRVTSRTVVMKLRDAMVGIRYTIEIRLMAVVTICRKRDTILSVDMALLTSHALMQSREWESCFAMIEICRFPRSIVVADGTILIELSRHVIRRCDAAILRFVTTPAIRLHG